ncbi:MAG TPA: opioid growth factor receptor-related protein [Gemmatimonadaceae bacterium]|jgi:hypothetical protein
MNEAVIAFYSGTGQDATGRRLTDVWQFPHEELEDNHDYIQWLFPLTERSAFNPEAPILDDATIARFRSNDTLRRNLERSLEVMLDFYGLEITGDRIIRAPRFADRSMNWLTSFNHNFLRLTRILKSLSLLGLEQRAEQLFACLEGIYASHGRVIGERTMSFWRHAVEHG